MRNAQVREGADHDLDGYLDIISIGYTIQGEGPFAGQPAVFVRLAGCNLQCPGCDTNYTKGRRRMSPNQIKDTIQGVYDAVRTKNRRRSPLVVLTGGEPFRQNIVPLVELLLQPDIERHTLRLVPQFKVQVETNGTYPLPIPLQTWPQDNLTVVCSPKTKINRELVPYIHSFKYILKAGEVNPHNGLPIKSLDCNTPLAYPPDNWRGKVYLQPYDEGDPSKNKANQNACIDSCMQFGYTLCLQLHKIIGLD